MGNRSELTTVDGWWDLRGHLEDLGVLSPWT